MPVSLKENIIQIEDYQIYERDITIRLELKIKLDFCADSNLCANYYSSDDRKCPQIGMVINNQLVVTTKIYKKEQLYYKSGQFDRYIVFIFPQQCAVELEKYKKDLEPSTF